MVEYTTSLWSQHKPISTGNTGETRKTCEIGENL